MRESGRQQLRRTRRAVASAYPWTLLTGTLVLLLPAVATGAGWRHVTASELRSTFVDHELGDGVHYAYQFHRDGTFTGYEMAREVRGTWRIADREFCWTWLKPSGAEECFAVERQGLDIRLMRDGAEFQSGKLSPIKTKRGP